jgi:hypothetical protein
MDIGQLSEQFLNVYRHTTELYQPAVHVAHQANDYLNLYLNSINTLPVQHASQNQANGDLYGALICLTSLIGLGILGGGALLFNYLVDRPRREALKPKENIRKH